MEKKLFEDRVITLEDTDEFNSSSEKLSNKSLIQIEATLLDMASTPELCQGLLYLFPVCVHNKYIVRYFYFVLFSLCYISP